MQTREEQIEHYRAVRRRIYAAAARCSGEPAPVPTPAPVARVKRVLLVETKSWRIVYFMPIGPVRKAQQAPRRLTAREIIEEVAARYQISTHELIGPCRQYRLVKPRQEIFYRLYDETRFSMPQIGRFCGGRDHTTVLHGIRAYAAAHGLPVPKRER